MSRRPIQTDDDEAWRAPEEGPRKLLVSLLVFLILALMAKSGLAASLILGGKKKKTADPMLGDPDNPVNITLVDGLRVEFKETFLLPNGDPHSLFFVTPPKDMMLEVNMADAFDTQGRQYGTIKDWIQIGYVRGQKREIIEGVRTPVWFPNAGQETPPSIFARLRFWFNGKELVFRKVKIQEPDA